MEFPILHDPGSVELLINTLFKNEPPKLVDHDYLVGLGFKREVDEGLLMLLTFLGLIDENGQPSALWKQSRDPDQAVLLLGKAVKASYGSLFKRFPNAYQEDGSVLMEFFRVETGDSDPNVAYMILTFKVLCDLAGLNEIEPAVESPEPVKKAVPEKKPDTRKKRKNAEAKKPAEKEKPAKTEKPVETESPAETKKQNGGPVVRVSINIDIDDRSDPVLRDLVMKLLKRQLEL